MKIISLLTLLFSSQILMAEDTNFGKLDPDALISLHEERIHNLVASSSDIRRSLEGGRSVAGQSAQEQAWAQEYVDLMKNEDENDYLGLALEL